jgi:hypothetical protein
MYMSAVRRLIENGGALIIKFFFSVALDFPSAMLIPLPVAEGCLGENIPALASWHSGDEGRDTDGAESLLEFCVIGKKS